MTVKKYINKESLAVGSIVLFFTVVYAMFSILRHWHFYSSGFDLGIFDQTVWRYSRFHIPENTVRGFNNILGDHFSPILILLAPLYWIFPRAESLLVAQAFLIASSAIPVYLFAKKRLEGRVALVISVAYAMNWGLLNAIAFDFHEIAFAVPLIAWIVYAIDVEKWRWYAVLVGLLLLVKENQALFVMACGIVLVWKRKYGYALVSLLMGAGWFVMVTKAVIPALSGKGSYGYWSYDQLGKGPGEAVANIVRKPWLLWEVATAPVQKVSLVIRLLRPFLGLALLSPYAILILPNLAERLLSSNQSYWVNNFHYSATIVPVIAMAATDSLYRITERTKKPWSISVVWAVVIAWLIVAALYVPRSNISPMFSVSWYSFSSTDVLSGRAALDLIPRDTSVIAQDVLIPHLSSREHIYQLNTDIPESRGRDADYIISTQTKSSWPMESYEPIQNYLEELQDSGKYGLLFNKDGWMVLRHR